VRKLGVVVAGLAVIALVFWLKVQHAVGVCAEAGGRWDGSDCLFDERR
jgi:hypothetical protein